MKRASLLAVPVLVALIVSLAAAAPQQPEALATAVISRVAQPGLPDQVSLSVAGAAAGRSGACRVCVPGGRLDRADRLRRAPRHRPTRRLLERAGRVGALAVSLFGGEITIDSLDVRASVAAGSANASANVAASTLTGLTVLGQLITPSANAVIPLADWGSLELLGSSVETVQKPPRSANGDGHRPSASS